MSQLVTIRQGKCDMMTCQTVVPRKEDINNPMWSVKIYVWQSLIGGTDFLSRSLPNCFFFLARGLPIYQIKIICKYELSFVNVDSVSVWAFIEHDWLIDWSLGHSLKSTHFGCSQLYQFYIQYINLWSICNVPLITTMPGGIICLPAYRRTNIDFILSNFSLLSQSLPHIFLILSLSLAFAFSFPTSSSSQLSLLSIDLFACTVPS